MTIRRIVTAEGQTCAVTISDDYEALLAAMAAGGAVVGIAGEKPLPPGIRYLCTDPEEVPDEYWERAARRYLGLPLTAAKTERLIIREFSDGDPLEDPGPFDGDGVFSDRELRRAYIENQYGVLECGLYALVRKDSGRIAGKCGITSGELSYHIYPEFRGQGLAKEACAAVLRRAFEEEGMEEVSLKVREDNLPSLRLAEKLGFCEISRENGIIRMRLYRNLYNLASKGLHF